MSESINDPESSSTTSSLSLQAGSPWLEVVRERVEGLRYGVIQIVVHDGRVTQIECTEKVRFENSRRTEASPPTRRPAKSP